MIKKRIVGVILVREGIVVQSLGFRRYLPLGRPEIAAEYLNDWGVDEIAFLDISPQAASKGPELEIVGRVARSCQVPLLVGGGIRTLAQARELVRRGADKLAFNYAALHTPKLLSQTADIFGNQCVVGAMDSLPTASGHRVYDHQRRRTLAKTPVEHAQTMVQIGCGEIFLNSISRDGSQQGFDLPLVRKVKSAVKVPVICCGGAGRPSHFVRVFQATDVHAAAAGNFFHYTEHSVMLTKAVLRSAGIPVRLDTRADYLKSSINGLGRLNKKSDRDLEYMKFIKIEKEVI